MIQLVRNFIVGTVLPIGGILLVGLLQRAFEILAPDLSDRSVGFTDLSSLLQIIAVPVAFFTCGFFGPRWIRGRASILWLLLPIVAVYALAVIRAPDLYAVRIDAVLWTLMLHAQFLVPLVATVVGYVCFRLRHAAPPVV
jgi:hypothetical protein